MTVRIEPEPAAPAVTVPRRRLSPGRKVLLLLLLNLILVTMLAVAAEFAVRLFWTPRSWVHAEEWRVGSGFGPAGRKWWPNTHFWNESSEFSVRFASDARGYRARPEAHKGAHPLRVAFVGDSYTEAKQVKYADSFVARLERELTGRSGGREVVAENYGIAGTGVFDYWHRITHDILGPGAPAPDVLVVCLFPGNDFDDPCPDDGFAADGQPLHDYYQPPRWPTHVLTWLNLKSKLAHFLVFSLKIAIDPVVGRGHNAPPGWWNEPARLGEAERSGRVRHIRALLQAIEAECDRKGTRLAWLIVPARDYSVRQSPSPLGAICRAWGLKSPVLDVAAGAAVTPRPARLVFPLDCHLNPLGHAFVAEAVADPLARLLGLAESSGEGQDHSKVGSASLAPPTPTLPHQGGGSND